jgi:outer membrane protein
MCCNNGGTDSYSFGICTFGRQRNTWQVRLRGVSVQPNEKSNVSAIGGDVNISNSFIPELDFTYFFNKNFAAELILGTSKHDVKVGNDEVSLGSVRLLPPTVTLQYHFYPTKSLKPYVGAGLNYTIFYDVENGDTLGMDYKNNVGFALQGGVDYFVNDKFFLNVDINKIIYTTL